MEASLQTRLDLARLTQNLGKPESVERMLGLYLKATRQSLKELEAAEKADNIKQWLSIAHSMKGAAQNITAKRMASLCLEAEEIKTLPHEGSKSVLYHLHKEFGILEAMISGRSSGQ